MHPFSLAELANIRNEFEKLQTLHFSERNYSTELDLLFEYGGFPEPLFKQNKREQRRWSNEKVERLFREDVRDLHQVRDIQSMKLLSDILPERVGSLFSANSVREDMEVIYRAVSNWLDILEYLYYHFRLYPFTAKTIRSLKKEPKLYLWDWSEIRSPGARFENLVASHLLKWVHLIQDYHGYNIELFYLRDVDKRELDFLDAIDKNPFMAIEVKLNDTSVAPSLFYFRDKLNIPYVYQVTGISGYDKLTDGIRIISADRFLTGLI